MKNLFKIFTVLLTIALFSTIMVACNPKDANQNVEAKPDSYVTVDINPSVEFVLDQNQVVLSAKALNADAEVMLYNETGIIGVAVDVATQKIVELAITLGYITEENSAVSVSVAANAGGTEEQAIYAKVNASISAAGIAKSINLIAENSVDFITNLKLEKAKEENQGKEGYDDSLTTAKFRLVNSAMAFDTELTMDVAVKMDVSELSAIVEESHQYYKDKVSKAYEKTYKIENRILENFKESYIDMAYAQVYAERFQNDPSLSVALARNYGIEYMAYRTAYRSLENLALTVQENINNPILTNEDVERIANKLNVNSENYDEFVVKISDANGNVTSVSINAYINKEHRNMDTASRLTFEGKCEEVESILDEIEVEEETLKTVDSITLSATINVLQLKVTVSRNPELESALSEINDIDDVQDVLDILEEIIDNTKETINNDLTDEEKERVAEIIEEHKDDIIQAEANYNSLIANAEATARASLEAAKNARIEANVTVSIG